METIRYTVSCRLRDSFRVRQVAGMFDVPLDERLSATFDAELPELNRPWQIGLIVGPSASGKSTLAAKLFGASLAAYGGWPADRAVIDCFGELPLGTVTRLLSLVGFSSPPAWLRPYAILSGGERFRCDLARALAAGAAGGVRSAPGQGPLVVFDEFSSVVDRQVARFASAALAKALRGGRLEVRFVAVTCHYDVEAWLEPDWTIDMATGRCHGRRLRRPPIRLEVFGCSHGAWRLFARHHYLTAALNPAARCWLALWEGRAVAFCAVLPEFGRRNRWRISRLVTLPDYQGVGIGMRMAECVAQSYRDAGGRVSITGGHPAVIDHCRRSPLWRLVGLRLAGRNAGSLIRGKYRGAVGRSVVSFRYAGRNGSPPAASGRATHPHPSGGACAGT